MKFHLLLIFTLFAAAVHAQPGTEVYLFDLAVNGADFKLSNPQNISQNSGYDNQPSFSSRGDILYYTSWQKNDQTDIIAFDIATATKQVITNSDGSEYSPVEMPGGKKVSTIILERDGRQLLWSYDLKSKQAEVVVPEVVIGYHCWLDKKNLYSFVLGAPPTLQRHNLKKGTHEVIDEKIGRSLHKIPGEKALSYISKKKKEWAIMKYDPKTGSKDLLVSTLSGSEDMCWTPTGSVIMGQGNQLYFWSPGNDWQLFANLSNFDLKGVTRLAVSPDGKKLAVVVSDPE